jgi:hypothetical protein
LTVKDRMKKKTSSVRIPRDLHTQLKIIAAKENMTLQKVVGKACTDLVKLNETEKPKTLAFGSPVWKSENPLHQEKK